MNEPLRISAKHLAALSMADVCERCFWLQLKCRWRLPFSIFPSIFGHIDGWVKACSSSYFAHHGRLPVWLPPHLGSPMPVPHWSKFSMVHMSTNILLVGAPDEMCRCPDGTLSIIDYKTARYTNTADTLFPLYEAQLNGYACIAASLGLGRVSSLWLTYCEPLSSDQCSPLGLCSDDGFEMRFSIKNVPVTIRPDTIPQLLTQARRIADLESAPRGRAGCKDCSKLDTLIIFAMEEDHERISNQGATAAPMQS